MAALSLHLQAFEGCEVSHHLHSATEEGLGAWSPVQEQPGSPTSLTGYVRWSSEGTVASQASLAGLVASLVVYLAGSMLSEQVDQVEHSGSQGEWNVCTGFDSTFSSWIVGVAGFEAPLEDSTSWFQSHFLITQKDFYTVAKHICTHNNSSCKIMQIWQK